MHRPLEENTAYPSLNPNTTLDHIIFGSDNRYLNHLFAFFFCVNAGDFAFDKIHDHLTKTDHKHLPNTAVFMDRGVIAYAYLDETNQRFAFHKYPTEVVGGNYAWCFAHGAETLASAHLAFWYGQLISHFANSYLPTANAYPYIQDVGMLRKSTIQWAPST